MRFVIVAPVFIFVVSILICRPETIVLLAWSARQRFREIIYNMNRETSFFQRFLGGFQFEYTVDLGCGYGLVGRYLRDRTEHLVGVDIDRESLRWTRKKRLYDELILADIRKFKVPEEADSVFLIEVLEHLDRKDGEALLNELHGFPFVCITTPSRFLGCSHLAKFMGNGAQKHRSVWSQTDFEELGYTVHNLKYAGVRRFLGLFLGNEILAVKQDNERTS